MFKHLICSVNTLLKTNRAQQLSIETAAEDENSGRLCAYDSFTDDSLCLPPTERHIVWNWSDLTNRYHGPRTLITLCNEFREDLEI